LQAQDRIICALDVPTSEQAIQLVRLLSGQVSVYKVGLELLMNAGIQVVDRIYEAGARRVFLDAKLHDIPNTIAGAMRGVARSRAWCVTVHCAGGAAMLRAARDAAESHSAELGVTRPLVLGVTLLTSLNGTALHDELQVVAAVPNHVAHLACLAYSAGCDGVIASPHEIETVRRTVSDPDFLIITPGVRPEGTAHGDQARVMTPGEAIRRGADYVVIGRPIVGNSDPVAATTRIAADISLDLQAH